MKKLSQINEGIFTNGIHRKNQGLEKKEDSLEVKLQEFCSSHDRNIDDYTITKECLVDCSVNVVIFDDDLVDGKLPFKFGKVKGDFYCSWCESLISLEGCPQEVEIAFVCSECKNLNSLEGCPKEVGGFFCRNCKKQFSKEEVKNMCYVKGVIYV